MRASLFFGAFFRSVCPPPPFCRRSLRARLLAPNSDHREVYHATRWASSVCVESEEGASGEDTAAPDG